MISCPFCHKAAVACAEPGDAEESVMGQTAIEWTELTWNPVTGCDRVSPGCDNGYAERLACRLQAMGNRRYTNGFAVTLHWDKIEEPLRWRKPRLVFVNSMSDLFHPDVPDNFIGAVIEVIRRASDHTFQVLTKRPQQAWRFFDSTTPPSNLWIGTSIENDRYTFRANYLRKD